VKFSDKVRRLARLGVNHNATRHITPSLNLARERGLNIDQKVIKN